MRILNRLTDTQVKNIRPRTKTFKVADGGGLFLLVQTSGSRYWRYKYRYAGMEKSLALGVYPEVSLAAAREARTGARNMLRAHTDPGAVRRDEKRRALIAANNSFEAVAREWLEKQKNCWTGIYAKKALQSLEADVFPSIGHRPIDQVSAPELLALLRKVEHRGVYDTAHRILQRCNAVFRYGIVTGRCERNPATDLRGALKTAKKTHFAALSAADLPEFIKRLEKYDGYERTKLAIRLLMLTFVRTKELRGARWAEVSLDGDKPIWRIPPERMKMHRAHIVPLSRQAVEVLRRMKELTGHGELVFPSERRYDKPMSENTILFALYRMGYKNKATGHGFRSTASTILNESGWRPDVIERQLAHGDQDETRAAYNRAEYLNERHTMVQFWADYLDTLGTNIRMIPVSYAKIA